jgi:hypothetical protein
LKEIVDDLKRGRKQQISVNSNVKVIIREKNFIPPVRGLLGMKRNATVFSWAESSTDEL